ncbi:: HTH_17 [Gemmata massiliana]|uniref:: HTH_17 n=1 Tax=Gemmata massiliana TaxID=1210884 RepID=A0A6P2DM69_9BACT|nr:helix-turn-helix domain-containing protein [Gemmata massiliana]VTS03638.1 : HTH_17 [Gemmata massiliana]
METVAEIDIPTAPPLVPSPPEGRQYLTPEEIAAAYEVSLSTVNRWLVVGVTAWDESGQKKRILLRGRKIGGRWKIAPAELAEFLRQSNHAQMSQQQPETEADRKQRVEACLKKLADLDLL